MASSIQPKTLEITAPYGANQCSDLTGKPLRFFCNLLDGRNGSEDAGTECTRARPSSHSSGMAHDVLVSLAVKSAGLLSHPSSDSETGLSPVSTICKCTETAESFAERVRLQI